MVTPTKDAPAIVWRYLEKNFGLEIDEADIPRAPGYLKIKPSNTVIHVKGIQKESAEKSNAYYQSSFDHLKEGDTQFLVLVRYDKDNLGDSFILPLKIVERIFGGLSPTKKGNSLRYVFNIKEADGKHLVKCSAKGGKWVNIEDYKNLSGWKQIPDITIQPGKHERGSYLQQMSLPGGSINSHESAQYYLLELGNKLNFLTYTPDVSREFNGTKLGNVATIKILSGLTRDSDVYKIDVIWCDEESYSSICFEIEHTTDFTKSFFRFSGLRTSYTKFFFVAPEVRRTLFNKSIKQSLFKVSKERFHFISYEELAELYQSFIPFYNLIDKVLKMKLTVCPSDG